jgi:spermidine synthase
MLHAIIFVTGSAVLALELLASRVMTPYFGVSLYIWTGILSITLIALALGYWAGGLLAAGRPRRALSPDALTRLFFTMPAAASAAVVAASLVYPYLFPWLARYDLVSGAFFAGIVLLFVPLVATSAMNPLLVAILLARTARKAGDAGAGRVFFVSTLGSVAGVLVTAFGLIPNLTNFISLLVIAVVLAVLPFGVFTVSPRRGRFTAAAIAVVAISAGMLWKADAYTARMWPVDYNGARWRIEAVASSLFGTVKVLKTDPLGGDGLFVRVYFHDGLIQNRVVSDGRSLSFYTYALEALARSYRPDMRSALMLGLGAGIVPMRLARGGVAVDVVDIDPVSFAIAQRYFGFEPRRVNAHLQDARTYLRECGTRYDVILVDLFHGDGMPEYLLTREFFADIKACLGSGGVAAFNGLVDPGEPAAYAYFLVTLRAELPAITVYRPPDHGGRYINSFAVAAAEALPDPQPSALDDVIATHAETLAEMLRRPRALDAALLGNGAVVTDARNAAARETARAQLAYRRMVVEELPAAFLLN